MAVIPTEQSMKSDLEKEVRIAMIRADVTQTDLAHYEDIKVQGINNRLRRLNRERAQQMLELVREVAEWKDEQMPVKATA